MAPNRRLRQTRVVLLAYQMREGLWRFTGEPIRFNVKGQLCDGQHRLQAVLQTGLAQKFLVLRNLPEDAMTVVDTGRPRSLSDFLFMRGEARSGSLAAAIHQLNNYQVTGEFGKPPWAGTTPIQRDLDLLEKHPGLRQSVVATGSVSSAMAGGHGIWAAIHYVCAQVSFDDAEMFFTKLYTGEELGVGAPIRLLRTRLLEDRNSLRRMDLRTRSALILKAWGLFLRGEQIEVLSWRGGGANPEAYPPVDGGVDFKESLEHVSFYSGTRTPG